MYIGLLHSHSYWAYLTVALVVLAFIFGLTGLVGKRSFTGTDRKVALFALIATHTQVLFGVVLAFLSPMVQAAFSDFGAAMKDSSLRLYALEHPLMMVLAVVMITVGFKKVKSGATDAAKFKAMTIFYGIAVIAILSRIPYATWF